MFGLWTKGKFTPVVVPEWLPNSSRGFISMCSSVKSALIPFVKQFNFFSQKPGWIEGNIREYSYALKVYRDPSNMGINGGRISKLELWKNGSLIVSYDRGWDKKPTTKAIRDLVDELIGTVDPWHMARRVTKCC